MKRIAFLLIAVTGLGGIVASTARANGGLDQEASPINRITIPPGFRDWKLVSVAHEAGNLNDFRAVLGNDIAIKAYREGTLQFPDGSVIVRLAWKYTDSKETTKPLAVSSPLLPVLQSMSSSWSRTQESTPRRTAGGSRSSKMANRTIRHNSKLVLPAMSPPKPTTSSSLITQRHLDNKKPIGGRTWQIRRMRSVVMTQPA